MSSPLSAQPLKVASVNGSSKGDQGSRTPVASRGASPGPSKPVANPAHISSPHELTAFVCFLLFLLSTSPLLTHSRRWKRCSSSSMRSSTICPRRWSIAVRCSSRCFSLLISHMRAQWCRCRSAWMRSRLRSRISSMGTHLRVRRRAYRRRLAAQPRPPNRSAHELGCSDAVNKPTPCALLSLP
jgi:hypothetical protein